LVDIYISQKHYGKALKVLQKILQMDPNDERCLKKLAEVEKLIGVDIEPVSEPERPQMTNRLSNSDDKDEFEYHKIEKVYDKFLKAIYDRAERALT
jgi:tetratricopeptide (TPR) repeat protein